MPYKDLVNTFVKQKLLIYNITQMFFLNPIKHIQLKLILTLIIISFPAKSQTNKQFIEYIKRFDISDEAKSIPKNSPSYFWQTALYNNERLLKFRKEISKNKGAETEAKTKISEFPYFYPQYNQSINHSLQEFCDSILIDMGIPNTGIECSLHIINSEEIQTYTLLKEKGFAICLTSALIKSKGVNNKIIKGFIAHEFAHGALMHDIRKYYKVAKSKRGKQLATGFIMGLNAFSNGLNGTNNSTLNTVVAHELNKDIESDSHKDLLKYSKEQNIEADLLAFRFMENIGLAEEYINSLRILAGHNINENNPFATQATSKQRIDFIKYAQSHPELGNTINKKLRKKRLKQELE